MSISLPSPSSTDDKTLTRVISERRSHREFSENSIQLNEVSLLLWAAQGITDSGEKRSAPSAGAQYPSHLYVIAGNVAGISPGVYQYSATEHCLDLHVTNNVQEALCDAAIDDQPWVREAALTIVLTADFELMKDHFYDQEPQGERGERYIYLEAGSIAQNIQLQACSIDLGAVLVGGFDDDKLQQVLNLDKSIKPTALICVGAKKTS